MQVELTSKEKGLLFWASFLSLMAAAFGFAYRVMVLGDWGAEFNLTGAEQGRIFGASLWPIAITMILFSLIVDFVGYKLSMFIAFFLQAASVVLTFLAKSPDQLYVAALCAGLGHGIVEAVINPVCAAVYNKDKTKWLNILHAAWPAGLAVGATLIIVCKGLSWQVNALWMLIPVIIYGAMFIRVKFPVDERVAAKVSYLDSLKDVGFLSATMAAFLITYEISNVATGGNASFTVSLIIGLVIGAIFGFVTKSLGRPLYFILCLLMVPLATTELGTDAWIKELMTPVMGEYAGWAIVLSAAIMTVLRFQAGILTSRFTAPIILTISSCFSMAGLIMLSQVGGIWIFVAFVLYAVGQTFYWPTVLGLASEQYPKGGALSLNTVSAIGLLSVGIIGTPIIGAINDNHTSNNIAELSQEIYTEAQQEASIFGVRYQSVDAAKVTEVAETLQLSEEAATATTKSGRQSLFTVALAFPMVMGFCFLLIALWFRARGGYKPVDLNAESAH